MRTYMSNIRCMWFNVMGQRMWPIYPSSSLLTWSQKPIIYSQSSCLLEGFVALSEKEKDILPKNTGKKTKEAILSLGSYWRLVVHERGQSRESDSIPSESSLLQTMQTIRSGLFFSSYFMSVSLEKSPDRIQFVFAAERPVWTWIKFTPGSV